MNNKKVKIKIARNQLKKVILPEDITEFEIPNNVKSIGDEAFRNCKYLTSIIIPNGVTSIGSFAFDYCLSLTDIAIPNSVTSIGAFAFCNCKSLKKINIPNSVKSIDKYAFMECTSLVEIAIPNSVKSIGSNPFSYCSSLTCITVESNNKVYDSRNNSNAIIHTSTNTLIAGCDNTVIPNSVKKIDKHAFFGCPLLKMIVIPNSVNKIEESAFSTCDSLIIYCGAKSKPSEWNSHWNPHNRPVYWGISDVNTIEQNGIHYLIKDNEAIVIKYVGNDTKVEIPLKIDDKGNKYNVTKIGNKVFSFANNLENIVINNTIKTLEGKNLDGEDMFIILNDTITDGLPHSTKITITDENNKILSMYSVKQIKQNRNKLKKLEKKTRKRKKLRN